MPVDGNTGHHGAPNEPNMLGFLESKQHNAVENSLFYFIFL